MNEDTAQLVEGAWLDAEERELCSIIDQTTLSVRLDPADVVAVIGAGAGGVALPAMKNAGHTVLFEWRPDMLASLETNTRGKRGVTVVESSPLEIKAADIDAFHPTVMIVSLGGLELSRNMVAVLSQPLPSLESLVVIYGPYDYDEAASVDRMYAVDRMLTVWHNLSVTAGWCTTSNSWSLRGEIWPAGRRYVGLYER